MDNLLLAIDISDVKATEDVINYGLSRDARLNQINLGRIPVKG
jgi:hypothetical protein